MSVNYNSMSVVQLRQIIKERGLKNTSSLRKAQLVELLSQLDGQAPQSSGTQRSKTVTQEESVPETEEERNNSAEAGNRDRKSVKVQRSGSSDDEGNVQEAPASRRKSSLSSRENIDEAQQSQKRRQRQGQKNSPSRGRNRSKRVSEEEKEIPGFSQLDSGNMANGILEVLPDGYGFIRCENYLPGDNDVYVSHAQIRRFNLKTGDIVSGNIRVRNEKEKFSALLYVRSVNGFPPEEAQKRYNFEDMTPVFPDEKINLETPGAPASMRIMNLISPIGRGQRGMIVAPPKTGKTTLLKQVAKAVHTNYPDMNMIILLIDERPEEVTDMKEFIEGDNVEVIYSTFDELPEHHERVSEMVLERAKRLVEHKQDVVILLDSITRLARACNLTVQPSGRTLTGGLDPAALYMPKRFFGSARNMREGGSLTVLATALVETGSKMDDVVFEEFKGTGNMELVLDRRLSDKRVFPAINITRSGTRREEMLLTRDETEAAYSIRRALSGPKSDEAYEHILEMFRHTRNNDEFIRLLKRSRV